VPNTLFYGSKSRLVKRLPSPVAVQFEASLVSGHALRHAAKAGGCRVSPLCVDGQAPRGQSRSELSPLAVSLKRCRDTNLVSNWKLWSPLTRTPARGTLYLMVVTCPVGMSIPSGSVSKHNPV